ncbi:MAG: hypothetical protein Q7R39_07340 [Dehalococcoidia bacterium]|nr:hypothetical protein [Dehalococcoidia bacterium]
MAEREAIRVREAEAVSLNVYEEGFKYDADLRERAVKGRVVIRGKDRPWQQSRQGLIKFYLHAVLDDTSVGTWRFFVHDIRSHSGKHRHQGGLAIYVIEGRGWTVVDGQRHDWEEGAGSASYRRRRRRGTAGRWRRRWKAPPFCTCSVRRD